MKKSKPAVETINLSISWGKVNVLNQLNFKLDDGEKLAIVGPVFSEKSLPIKLHIEKIGGYLVIACDGSTAIELEYLKEEIIKKINSYYGFAAVSRIKFQNIPVQNIKKNDNLKTDKISQFNTDSKNKENIEDDTLSNFEKAILKLQKSIINKKNDL